MNSTHIGIRRRKQVMAKAYDIDIIFKLKYSLTPFLFFSTAEKSLHPFIS